MKTHKILNLNAYLNDEDTQQRTVCKIENRIIGFDFSERWSEVDCKACLKMKRKYPKQETAKNDQT